MKLLWNANVFGWHMTGLLGKGAEWFFGFSRKPARGVEGIDGPRRGPVADGSQKPNDAAAIPCAKAGSNPGVPPIHEGNPK